MQLLDFVFYLGVYSTDPIELTSYKFDEENVVEVLRQADIVIDNLFDGSVEFFLRSLTEELRGRPIDPDVSILPTIYSWLKDISVEPD